MIVSYFTIPSISLAFHSIPSYCAAPEHFCKLVYPYVYEVDLIDLLC